jgi:nitric oxide dioxygenase
MTPTEIALVQESFRKVVPISDQVAALFYARLFELDPTMRALFGGDMTDQGRRLMSMIGAAVAALNQFDAFLPTLRQLGARHGGYGATEEHYATVGAALLWTLEKGLGQEYTPAVRDAWTNTYSLLANTMIDAQREAALIAG